MNLLVTVDENYIYPLQIMLSSFFASNPLEGDVTLYLMHSGISAAVLGDLASYLKSFGGKLVDLLVDQSFFENQATSSRYPKEMYYRMLSPLFLPDTLERILYLDPDILVLNPLRPLYDMDLQDHVFAAASHNGLTEMTYQINSIRLDIEHDYFNTGVILMDLAKARKAVKAQEVFDTVRQYEKDLILPDQDVFNILYGSQTLAIDDTLWNYDARKYANYRVRSEGQANMHWIMSHTALLHFCGRSKPWHEGFHSLFSAVYLHYMNLTERRLAWLNGQKKLAVDLLEKS